MDISIRNPTPIHPTLRALSPPIARRVVEAHGGTIQIDTPESGGTIVSIALPSR
jgi:hypothetical protein